MASRPKVPEGIGQKSQFNELKLELKSHKNPEFEIDQNIFTIQVRNGGEELRSIFNLFQYDADGRENELKTCVLILTKDRTIKYKVAVDKTGWYKLNIFATPTSTKSNSLPCVYTYLFFVSRITKKACPYPKQFADWRNDYDIIGPRYLDPCADRSKVKFELRVPDAKKVALKVGDEWTHLEKKGSDKWEGNVCLSHHNPGTLMNLNACTGSDESSYATLLQYTL